MKTALASVAIQSLGAAATLGVGLQIAWWQGAAAQGHYGLVRTTADLIVAVLLFGFPQSLVTALQQGQVSAKSLAPLVVRYALIVGLILLGIGLLWPWGGGGVAWGGPWDQRWTWLALLLGAWGWVVQGLQRVFVLCRGGALAFSWLTVAPALSLLVAVTLVMALGRQDFAWAVAASGVASAVVGAWIVASLVAKPNWPAGRAWQRVDRRGLIEGGAHAFAQTVAMALQPWVSLVALQHLGLGAESLGLFVLATFVHQAFALPAAFLSPMLLARLSASPTQSWASALGLPRGPVVLAAMASVALACAILPWGIPAALGARFEGAVVASLWIALSAPCLWVNRWGVTAWLARGAWAQASWHAALRVALLLAWWCAGAWHVAAATMTVNLVSWAGFAWFSVEAVCAAWWWMKSSEQQGPTGARQRSEA